MEIQIFKKNEICKILREKMMQIFKVGGAPPSAPI